MPTRRRRPRGVAPREPDVPAVVAVDEQDDVDVDLDRWQSLAVAAFIDQGITAGECNLLFVDEATIRQLNFEHRDKDTPTDVLSFHLMAPMRVSPTT